jgi:hypothetical protein
MRCGWRSRGGGRVPTSRSWSTPMPAVSTDW